jgi:acyl dehydratase
MSGDSSIEVGPITVTDIVRFAGAGGDFNPLHHDQAVARAAGHPGLIAMGQMQAGMLARLITDRFPLADVREYRVRFEAPVRPGDALLLTAAETDREAVEGGVLVRLGLRVERDDGVIAVTGAAVVFVADVEPGRIPPPAHGTRPDPAGGDGPG